MNQRNRISGRFRLDSSAANYLASRERELQATTTTTTMTKPVVNRSLQEAASEMRRRCVSTERSPSSALPRLKELSNAVIETSGKAKPSKIPRRTFPQPLSSKPAEKEAFPVVPKEFCAISEDQLAAVDHTHTHTHPHMHTHAHTTEESESIADDPPIPLAPLLSAEMPFYPEGFNAIQNFINAFSYNHTSVPFYRLRKTGGTHHLLNIVEQIKSLAMPIQCVEAVFLGAALSKVWPSVDRIPISFKSKFQKSTHRHIVLAVHKGGKWGSLGISRRSCLMDKPMFFDSLWDLINDFFSSYESVFHRLLSVYVGLPIPHNLESDQPLTWKAIKLRIEKSEAEHNQQEIQKFLRRFVQHYKVSKS